jgi:hypothetical protein
VSNQGKQLTPTERLRAIAEILEQHDRELLASDGPVPQEPLFLRRIYVLAIGTNIPSRVGSPRHIREPRKGNGLTGPDKEAKAG